MQLQMKAYGRLRAIPSVTNVVHVYIFVLLFVFKHSSLSCPFSALIVEKEMRATSALCYSQLH